MDASTGLESGKCSGVDLNLQVCGGDFTKMSCKGRNMYH